jgi:hypothetical protein
VAQRSFIRRMYHRDQLSIEPRTVSRNEAVTKCDGVFLVSEDTVTAYRSTVGLRYCASTSALHAAASVIRCGSGLNSFI